MPFDPITWAIGYTASKSATALISKIFDDGAYSKIREAAREWSQELPGEIRTPVESLFDIVTIEPDKGIGSHSQKLKSAILELNTVPTEEEWFDALMESWEFKREQLGRDGNAFFRLPRSEAAAHLHGLAEAIFAACASVLEYSQPLLVKAMREVCISQSIVLERIESFTSPLNHKTPESNSLVSLNFNPIWIEETQLHTLNEIACVDSPVEVVVGRYRTHQIWIGSEGCSQEKASFVPLAPQYVEKGIRSLLDQWNAAAVDLAKLDRHQIISGIASFHHRFMQIHPYPDGNGRVARIILDFHIRNFTPSKSPLRLKSHDEYYLALRAADDGDTEHLIQFIDGIVMRDLSESSG